jgi:hypothetical protein
MRLGCDRRNGHPARQQQQPDPWQAVEPDQHRWARASWERDFDWAVSRADGISMFLSCCCAAVTTSRPTDGVDGVSTAADTAEDSLWPGPARTDILRDTECDEASNLCGGKGHRATASGSLQRRGSSASSDHCSGSVASTVSLVALQPTHAVARRRGRLWPPGERDSHVRLQLVAVAIAEGLVGLRYGLMHLLLHLRRQRRPDVRGVHLQQRCPER